MKASNSLLPSALGAYVLLIPLENPEAIEVGRLGTIDFPTGWYAYVGSALNGLCARVGRHVRRRKKLRWHVDYLLQKAQLSEVVWAPSDERLECRIASALRRQGLPSTKNFGASDCKCPSHLFHSPKLEPLRSVIIRAFTTLGVTPHLYQSNQPSLSFHSS